MIDRKQGLSDKEYRYSLTKKIRLGKNRFTPFLGAGAASLRPEFVPLGNFPWISVRSNIRGIADLCGVLGEAKRTKKRTKKQRAYRSYLESLISQNLRAGPSAAAEALDDVEYEAGKLQPKLLELQAEMAMAGALLSRALGKSFVENAPAIHSVASSCKVPFDVEITECKDAKAQVDKLAALALQLNDQFKGDRRTLEHDHETPGEVREISLSNITRSLDLLKIELETDAPAIPNLRLEHVQWLSDLLWYTLRYWVPRFPTTSELAFELSLRSDVSVVRRASLAQAAQAYSESSTKKLATVLREVIDPGHSALGFNPLDSAIDGNLSAFYAAIGALLVSQVEEVQERKEEARPLKDQVSRPNPRSDNPPKKDTARRAAIAFTTNYDRCLEMTFEYFNVPYHLVYPTEQETEVEWKISTWNNSRFEPVEPAKDFNPHKAIGPIIVKLHGAPFENLPGGAENHWIVLKESEYLQALMSKPPEWIGRELGPGKGRAFWFLGYSLADWNVRLRLYEHNYADREAASASDGVRTRRMVDTFYDPFQAAILEHLKVEPIRGDLNLLPAMIRTAFVDDEGQSRQWHDKSSQDPLVRMLQWVEKAAKTRKGVSK